jgi:hypothetical protein
LCLIWSGITAEAIADLHKVILSIPLARQA